MQKISNSKSLDKLRTISNLGKVLAINGTGGITAVDSSSSNTVIALASVSLSPNDKIIKFAGSAPGEVITTYNYATVPSGLEYNFIVKNISAVNVTVDGLGAARAGTQIVVPGEEIEFFIRLVATGWVALTT